MVSDNDATQSDVPLQAMDTDPDGEEAHVSSSGDRLDHTSVSGQVQCSVCSSTFRRPEHLKRHLRSHTKEKPFECAQCGRHFSRTDTLHRHELSHHTPGIDGGKDRTHRITVKTFRACFSCATARVRCSGGSPCGRCESRSLDCQYPTERRSKARARNGTRPPSSTDTLETQPQSSAVLSRPNRNNSRASQGEPEPYQLAQFSVNTLNDPQSSLKFSAVTFPNPARAPTESISSNGRESVSGPVDPRLYMPSSTPDLSAGPVPSAVYPNGEGQVQYNGISNDEMPKMFSAEAPTNVDTEMGQIQSNMPGSGDMAMEMAVNSEMDLDFDPAFFDQSMLSTINWLPNELFARPDDNQGPPFRTPSQFSQSALSDQYMARMPCHPPVINTNQVSPSVPDIFPQTPSGRISMGTELGSPRRHSHVASDASPHSESVDSAKRSADYYVDGGGSRLPRYRKKQTLRSTSSIEVASVSESFHDTTSSRFNFPSAQVVSMENVSEEVINAVRPIDSTTYNEIYRNFVLLCRSENPFFETFEEDSFPSAEDCSQFLVCYFDSFQTVYPMLHLSSFDPNKCYWLLTLAVVAIGCHCSNNSTTDQLTEAFHEMIRRALHVEKEKSRSSKDSLELIQALLLNCIGLLHIGSDRTKTSALSTFKELVFLMNREKLLSGSHTPTHKYTDEAMWMAWVQDEVRRRTGYCIWLLDCTNAYSCQDQPLLSLDDGQAPLPAHETWWQATSAEAWKQLQENQKTDSHSPYQSQTSSQASFYPTNQSLYDAVHILYIEKRLVTGIGEFSHILLIHALYHRMWEVGDYFRRPLSFWNPTAKKQSRETAIPTGSVWLPGIPSYSKWRNSACDCLDILHWAANSTIAKAAGLEHPTVLHLHVARLVLLTPYQEIRSLATALATNKTRWSKRLQAIEWQYIWRWVRHDQYKARLSIIHAGVTLWHVKRYSTNAYHEPTAAFLAVLTLWAYGSCHAHAPAEPSLQGSRPDSTQEPSFIHLDRPCDDELVQLFVREGHSMRGNVTGVGDICAPEGPERVLRVGCEIMSSLTAWGNSKRFATILNRLADLASRNSAGEQGRNDRMDND